MQVRYQAALRPDEQRLYSKLEIRLKVLALSSMRLIRLTPNSEMVACFQVESGGILMFLVSS